MKKLAIVLMILLLLASGAALASEETTRIVLWHSASEEAGALMERYIADFNATIGAELGVEVEAVFQGAYSDAVAKMNSLISVGDSDSLPDVMQLDATGKVTYMAAAAAYTADDARRDHPQADFSDFLPPALANWNLAGTQLGLPFATSTTVMYYNKSRIDAAPDTLADIGRLAEAADVPAGEVVYACVPNTPTLANWLGQMGGYLVDERNGSEGNATELACIEDGTLATFLREWKALYATGALKNSPSSSDEFVAGKQWIMTSSSSSVRSVLERVGGSFELGVAPYPRVQAEASGGATVSGSCLVMFDHGQARREAAWALVQYLTSADVQADFAAGTGYLPSCVGATETDVWRQLIEEEPLFAVGFEQLLETPRTMCSVTVGPSADFYYTIQDTISEMLEEDLTVEETVELMEDELGSLLAQYARANG